MLAFLLRSLFGRHPEDDQRRFGVTLSCMRHDRLKDLSEQFIPYLRCSGMLSQFLRYGLGYASALEYPVPTVSEADHCISACAAPARDQPRKGYRES